MPAKKLKTSPSLPTVVKATHKNTAKKASRKPLVKEVSVVNAKPSLKNEKITGLEGGFTRISETQIRKIYR